MHILCTYTNGKQEGHAFHQAHLLLLFIICSTVLILLFLGPVYLDQDPSVLVAVQTDKKKTVPCPKDLTIHTMRSNMWTQLRQGEHKEIVRHF